MSELPSGIKATGWRMPDTLLIVFAVLLCSALLTLVVPQGQFDTALDTNTGRQLLLADSYRTAHNGEPQAVALFADGEKTGVLTAFFDGMTSGSRNGSAIGVIIFILLVGGSFGVLLRTGAVDELLKLLISKMQHKARLLLPVMARFFPWAVLFLVWVKRRWPLLFCWCRWYECWATTPLPLCF